MKLDIAAIKARADKATAGPWAWNSRHGLGAPNRLVMWPSHEYGCDLDIEGEEADLDFIAHARTDIPDLLAALEAAERERDVLAGEMDCHDEEIRLWEEQFEIDRKTITDLEAERDALMKALNPFVEALEYSKLYALHLNTGKIRTDDLRAARRALKAKP